MDAQKIDAAIDFLATSIAELIKFVVNNPTDFRRKLEFLSKLKEANLVFEHFEEMGPTLWLV